MIKRYTKEEFIKRAKEIHGNKYDYSNINLKTCTDKIKIFCKKHHKYFIQRAYSHLTSTGCKECVADKKT